MAYARRYRPKMARRRFRRTTRKYRKRGIRTKRVFRKSRRTFRKRVLAISSKKKFDTMRSGSANGVIDVTFNDVQQAIMAWSPTTIPYNEIEHSPAHRNSQQIFFTGVKETMDPYAIYPFHWRRVVFWTHERFPQFETVVAAGGTRFRYGVTYGVTDTPVQAIQELMFQGTIGIDWDPTRPMDARLDRHRIKIVSDRRVNFNPQSDNGRYSVFKRWHGIRRRIMYDQEEAGDDQISDIWSTVAPTSSGNLFIVDFFGFPPGLAQGAQARLGLQSTVYWRES